jgi:hypothetical protein
VGADVRHRHRAGRQDPPRRRRALRRDYPPAYQPTFRIEYSTGGETIGKVTLAAIWDPHGSVSQHVQDLSAQGIR